MTEDWQRSITSFVDPFRVEPGRRVTLAKDFDPGFTDGTIDKVHSTTLLEAGVELLSEYQERLAAQDTYGVLIVVQGIDAAGKDSTIRHVMSGVNPQGVTVHSFKEPSTEELDHDFLWRYTTRLPARGHIGIFNRSHYEEVLVVRVHPEFLDHQRSPAAVRGADVWKRRYRAINNWERHLCENGFRIVKLFLNLSREEQRKRFIARIDKPHKNWKFSANDVKEREYWDDYQVAFSDMLSNTSTEWAPWHVLPADHKWFARMAASAIIVRALMDIDPRYPIVDDAARAELHQAKALLDAEAPGRGAEPKTSSRSAKLQS